MYLIIFLIINAYAIPLREVTCGSGLIFRNGACSNRPGANGPFTFEPTYSSGCAKMCHQEKECVLNTRQVPTKTVIYPYNSNPYSSNVCSVYGTKCPDDCTFKGNKCDPINNANTCYPVKRWICPQGCEYNNVTKMCKPLNPNNICNFINQTLSCPKGCWYREGINKCVSDNINIVCGPYYGLVCPSLCRLNVYGDKCLPYTANVICTPVVEPICCDTCFFDKTIGLCVSKDNDICGTTTQITCEPNYILNSDAPYCNKFNRDNLCKITESIAQYPTNLKYAELTCRYKYDVSCHDMPGTIISCPASCKINTIKNKCDSDGNTVCGSYFLSCPTNYVTYQWGCYGRAPPICKSNQIALNLSDNTHQPPYQIMCGDKWYHE